MSTHRHPELGWDVDPETGAVIRTTGRRNGDPIDIVGTHGYLCTSKGSRAILAHRVVWEACVGPIPPGLVVNHLNGLKTDNRLCNLEVVTQSENMRHARATGLNSSGGVRGPRNHNYKITPEMRAGIWQMLDEGFTQTQIARAYGVSRKAVWIIEREER